MNRNPIKLKSIAEDWLNSHKIELKPSSVAKYKNIISLYLVPKFGNKQISSIKRTEVMCFGRELLETGGVSIKGLSPKTVNSILSVLRLIFIYAKEERLMDVVDLKNVSVKQPKKKIRILSTSEQQRLAGYLNNINTPSCLGMLLCMYTGLRLGEICALKWGDISVRDQCIKVNRSMQRIQSDDLMGKRTKIIIQKPKSECSVRIIPIPDEIFLMLLDNRRSEDSFFLTGSSSRYVEPRCMENYFKKAAMECSITDVSFHVLRHTFATRCVELGFDIKSLSEILGHASVNITLNRYVHPSMDLKRKNMNLLSGYINEY